MTATTQPTLLYLIKQTERAVRARLDSLLHPSGITTLQYSALMVLECNADLTTTELARRSFIAHQSMADVLRTLERRGLLEKRQDEVDRRRAVLSLTPAGRKLLTRCRPLAVALEHEMVADLDLADATALRRTLAACRDALGPHINPTEVRPPG